MANTITVNKTDRGNKQFQGAFKEMFFVSGTIDDQDAVAATAIGEFDITVPGALFGDMVLGLSITVDLDDGTDQAGLSAHVSAANTVTVQVSADDGEFAADALNGSTIKMAIGRPNW